jgi:TolB-like protein/Tfp pilus assembly protein PilF
VDVLSGLAMSLFTELRRRNVLRMAVLYVAAAWLVIQGAGALIDLNVLPEKLGPWIMVALAIGFPIALALSWFYEITPEGVTPDAEVQRGAALPVSGRWFDFIVIAVLSAAVLLFAWDKWWTGPPPARSVAVLPFINMSADEEVDYLGVGVADTILNMLVKIPDLHVASRTSSFQHRLQGLSVPEIADLLGVAAVLEGGIQRQGDRVRVTAQLVNAASDSHLWSANFDRDYSDIFKIQDEVAAAAASALELALLGESKLRIDREGTDNLAAFEAYSKAIENLRVETIDSTLQAIEQLRRAVELDPDFARAHAMLGYTYLGQWAWIRVTDDEPKELAREAAQAALRIAPGLSTALTVLGRVTDDVGLKRELYREAVANDPNDIIALASYAKLLLWENRIDEGMALLEKRIRLDPLEESAYGELAGAQERQGLCRQALSTLARGKEKIPDSVSLRDREANCYNVLHDYTSMIRVKHETLAIDPKDFFNRGMIAEGYFQVGMPDEAVRWFERTTETAPETVRELIRLQLRTMLDIYNQRSDEEVFESLRRWITENTYFNWGFGNPPRELPPLYLFIEYGERLGRLDEVLSTFEGLCPHLFSDLPDRERLGDCRNIKVRGSLYVSLMDVVGEALLRAGDRQRGEPLLRHVLEWHPRHSGSEWRLFFDSPLRTLLALGETDAALEVFRTLNSAERLWYGRSGLRFVIQNNPLWAPIRATPEYAALMEELDRHAAEHRRKLQEMDLPLR